MAPKPLEGECHGVVLFYSISGALRAEKLFQAQGLSLKMIPVPRHLSSDCGVCVRFSLEDQAKVEEILSATSLQIQNICPLLG